MNIRDVLEKREYVYEPFMETYTNKGVKIHTLTDVLTLELTEKESITEAIELLQDIQKGLEG